eukprot:m.262588 g.262588  ORF g.262588 m.262588 type:complete len:182 (+) comp16222_c1_seq34:983-1528(+)
MSETWQQLKGKSLQELSDLCSKKVLVKQVDGTKRTGVVFTIDPESYTMILLQQKDEGDEEGKVSSVSCNILFGTSIVSYQIRGDSNPTCQASADALDNKIKKGTNPSTVSRNHERGNDLSRTLSWLQENRVDAAVEDDKETISIMKGVAWISPPYDYSCVRSENEMVLARVIELIKRTPVD